MNLCWEINTIGVQPGVASDKARLNKTLMENWEPFAVTWGDGTFVYHLRRLTDTE
jgi:hypothetical protein